MSDCSGSFSQQSTEVNALNAKLAYDAALAAQNSRINDDLQNARAWAAFNLDAARDAQVVKHLAQIAALATDQTGQTENQNLVKPIPNTVADNTAAVASGAENAAIAADTLANVTAQVAEIAAQVTALAAAVAQIVTNSGKAAQTV